MLFKYRVIDSLGKEKSGQLKAKDEETAVKMLQRKEFTIVSIAKAKSFDLDISIFKGVSSKELAFLSRQLATLFEAQITALRSFEIITAYSQNKRIKRSIDEIISDIKFGRSITEAFTRQNTIYGTFWSSVVAVGDESGSLEKSFGYLAEYFERNQEIYSRIKRALTYPIITLIIFFSIMFFLFTSVIPKISDVLLSVNAELPKITEIILAMSDFVLNNNLLILAGLGISIVAFVIFIKSKEGKAAFDKTLTEIPLISALVRQFYIVRFSSNMNVLLQSGVPILRALEVTGQTFNNVEYKGAMDRISTDVRNGIELSSAIDRQEIFGKTLAGFIRTGEESGHLGTILKNVQVFYQQSFNNVLDQMIDLIQPITIVILGAGVGAVIASVILPIYTLTSTL